MTPTSVKMSHGYTSNQIHQLIGSEFPNVEDRNFYSLALNKVVPEWSPSNYYKSISFTDDEGGQDDVLFYGPNTGVYHTCAISESNMKRAFHKRMLYGGKQHIINPVIKTIDDDMCFQKRLDIQKYLTDIFIPEYITPLPPGHDFRTALRDWMTHCDRYTVKKKQQLYDLLEQILSGSYEAPYHGRGDPLGLRVINMFQKCENYESIKEPRAISACSESLKAYIGGFIHLVDKHAINTTPFFVKGMNPQQVDRRRRLMSQKWSLFMGSDYSSYEGSQDYQWINMIEKEIYKVWLANYPEVYKILADLYENGHDIYWKKRYFGHLMGKRMSGDVQTSIGNGICNAVIWKYVSYITNTPIELLVEGDDAFICSDAELDVRIVNDLGFDCKIDGPTTNYEEICFLSRYSINGHAFGNIPKVLDKIGVVKSMHMVKQFKRGSKRSLKEIRDYAYTKAYCYMVMYAGTPIIDPLCRSIMRNSGGHFNILLMEDYYVQRLGSKCKWQDVPIYDDVRKRVSEIWPQFTVSYQHRVEEEIQSQEDLCYLIIDCF